jgi:hypothetical protein
MDLPNTFAHCRFWTLLTGAQDEIEEILPTIIDLARTKLICNHEIAVVHTSLQPAARTAVLNVLLSLDFEPRRLEAHAREAELVASNMCIAFSVPQDREYLRCGYPSEPILAEAAARQMDQFQMLAVDPDTSVMADILKSEFSSGLLDLGQRDEVVFRLLVSEAYRRAVRQDHPNDIPLNFSGGCLLTTFINTLFSEHYADQILSSVPDNVKNSVTFAEVFKDAIVRFTHFGKMADDTATTTEAMFTAFVRCMAIICCSSQDIVDLLIPILFNRREMLQESAMTGLLIQIKRRKKKGSTVAYEIDQTDLSFFPASIVDERPYITFVAELGVQLPISPLAITKTKAKGTHTASTSKLPKETARKPTAGEISTSPATPSKVIIPGIIHHPRDMHPRYSIYAYGCSNTVYNIISDSDRATYKFFLANRDMLDEHPRKDVSSLSAVRKMKPFWSAGIDCYDWIDAPGLQQHSEWLDDNGDLFVGRSGDGVHSNVID